MNYHLKTVLKHLIKYCDLHKILEKTFLIESTVSLQNCFVITDEVELFLGLDTGRSAFEGHFEVRT